MSVRYVCLAGHITSQKHLILCAPFPMHTNPYSITKSTRTPAPASNPNIGKSRRTERYTAPSIASIRAIHDTRIVPYRNSHGQEEIRKKGKLLRQYILRAKHTKLDRLCQNDSPASSDHQYQQSACIENRKSLTQSNTTSC